MADHFDGPPRHPTPHATAWRRTAASAAAALSLVLLASGCGGPRVNYAIPKDLCGITVDQKLLRPFFPPGDRIQFDGDIFPDANKATSICQYYVDGNTALLAKGTRSSEKTTAEQIVTRFANRAHIKSWAQPDGRIAGYEGAVFGTTTCSGTPSDSHGQPARTFTLEISINHFTTKESTRLHLIKLMHTVLPKAARARGC